MNIEKAMTEMHGMLIKIMDKLDEHSRMHEEHSRMLKEHTIQLKEHSQILNALSTGQEYLKAEFDGMKVSTAKEIGSVKEDNETLSINQELLRNEAWTNKVDIERIKKTMGMS
ncbi:hypothetical protein [Oceanobacillus sp. CAU 1775]